ncbi:Uncharacterized protein TCM_003412 [Theobroma cacao]|uniref:Uncharacterized protein n=1 Tax=Theobroma cacao TaxID=3641 RepID=A0A061DP01_THECC|nr:Uncharacterized protein TCM_003412 [Theobroma cacao]
MYQMVKIPEFSSSSAVQTRGEKGKKKTRILPEKFGENQEKSRNQEFKSTNVVNFSILYCVKVVSPLIKARELHPRTNSLSISKILTLDTVQNRL